MAPLCPAQHSARLHSKATMTGKGSGHLTFVPFSPPMVPPPQAPPPSMNAPQKKQCTRASKLAPILPAAGILHNIALLAPEPSKKLMPNITWEEKHADQLVEWITTHTTDQHILFHDHATSTSASKPPPGDKPSGKSKKEVSVAIARHTYICNQP